MNEQITVNLNNFTEEEREQFKKLLGKGSGEPIKGNRVWKPKKIDQYYYINDFTDVCTDTWQEAGADYKRFKIGNVYKTIEEAEIALERAKVKAELERYALEHNDPDYSGNDYYYIIMNTGIKDISVLEYWKAKAEGVTHFTSEKIAKDAIEAVGKERILKYLFGVDCEEETND